MIRHDTFFLLLAVLAGSSPGAEACPGCPAIATIENTVHSQAAVNGPGASTTQAVSVTDLTKIASPGKIEIEASGATRLENASSGGGAGNGASRLQVGGAIAGPINGGNAAAAVNVVGNVSIGTGQKVQFDGGARANVAPQGSMGDVKTTIGNVTIAGTGLGTGKADSVAAFSLVNCPVLPSIGLPGL